MKTKITIKTDYTKIEKGHQPHKSGAGPHKDKRTKRENKQSIIRRELDQ